MSKKIKPLNKYNLISQRCKKIIDLWACLKSDENYQGKWDQDELIRYTIILKIASMDDFFY
jgi:hypothetical protein